MQAAPVSVCLPIIPAAPVPSETCRGSRALLDVVHPMLVMSMDEGNGGFQAWLYAIQQAGLMGLFVNDKSHRTWNKR